MEAHLWKAEVHVQMQKKCSEPQVPTPPPSHTLRGSYLVTQGSGWGRMSW